MSNKEIVIFSIITFLGICTLAIVFATLKEEYTKECKEESRQQAFKDIRRNATNGTQNIFAFDVDGVAEMYEIKYIGVGKKGDK